MAYASDRLRERRMNKMGMKEEMPMDKKEDVKDSKPSDRSIQLSDEEMKSLGAYQPGQEAECLVKGRMNEDGTLDVTSVSPVGGEEQQKPPMPTAPTQMMPG